MLKLENIDVRYGPIHAVKDVSLTVDDAQIVAILGSNGAGKSSLLRAIAGAEKTSGGTIDFDGKPIDGLSPPMRVQQGITLVPEGRQIFVSMTVEENLLMGAYTQDQTTIKSGIETIFDRFPNLASRRHSLASVLSGGEQQMLAIGRAMIAKPRLMMLDEPGYLDGHHGEWLTPPERFEQIARALWNAGLKIHVHCTGDLGVELALSTLEKL